jgi:SAM-dependent methyltransferase
MEVMKNKKIGTGQGTGTSILENAYSLKTPDDNKLYYKEIANNYDQDFADDLGYIYPSEISKMLMKRLNEINGPICDIGCGTGLVGGFLKNTDKRLVIDGVDISNEMLAIARDKNFYRKLYNVDLTAEKYQIPNDYAALISAGTFTHGHLGPDPIGKLIDHCSSGAICFFGINKEHYKSLSFDAYIKNLNHKKIIKDVSIDQISIYTKIETTHGSSRANICSFKVC